MIADDTPRSSADSSSQEPLGRADLPGLFRVADDSSTGAQRRYVSLIVLNLCALLAMASQITPRMREIRGMPVTERKRVYLAHRIQDQRTWYALKAARNARAEDRLFLVVGGAQLGALIAAIGLAAAPGVWNVVGVLATVSASLLAWLQVKRHEELAQSYLVTAQELGLIAAQGEHVAGEEAFSSFVADAESAISREHTLWLARRDTLNTAQPLWPLLSRRYTGGR